MKNLFLSRIENATLETFTTDTGLKIRRFLNKPIRFILKKTFFRKLIVEKYPSLNEMEPYIFVSTHTCVDEIQALLATIDRSAYTLIGTKEQLENNPKVYANWLTGLIFVDRYNERSRNESLSKMARVINSGSSILLFPEGGWNNSENLPVMNLFPGFYKLAKLTGAKIVPISVFQELYSKKIYLKAENPVDVSKMEKEEACIVIRDILATMMFEQVEKYSTPIKRGELVGDIRLNYFEERRKEYLKTKWTKDVWDEELTIYKSKKITFAEDVRADFDNVKMTTITTENAKILVPILVKRLEDKKYDFKDYMHKNWNKQKKKIFK